MDYRGLVGLWVAGWAGFLGIATAVPCLGQDPGSETEIYRQAVDKLGGPSRVVWMEPGDTSLQRWEPRRSVEWTGVIVEWEPGKLVLVRRDGTGPTTLPGDHAIGLEPSFALPEFQRVHALFSQHQFAETIREGQSALKLPQAPRWQQRLIVAEMVQSASAQRQWLAAGRIYKALVQVDPPMLLAATCPIPWSDEPLTAGATVRDAALEWLQDSAPQMQLLGAAWLIGSDQRQLALDKLELLSRSDSTLVASYARAQLWRTVPPDTTLSTHYASWVAQRDAMPLSIQGGPTMLLGHLLHQAGQWELAVGEWLRVAGLVHDRYDLSRDAVRRAMEACRQAGAVEQAKNIAKRFPQYVEDPS